MGPLDFLVPAALFRLILALGSDSLSLVFFFFGSVSLIGCSGSALGTGEEARDFRSRGCAVSAGSVSSAAEGRKEGEAAVWEDLGCWPDSAPQEACRVAPVEAEEVTVVCRALASAEGEGGEVLEVATLETSFRDLGLVLG